MSPIYQTLAFNIGFTSPAFLGNAEQSGQWRTPPFKALLRQWWRVAYAAEHGFEVDVAQMRLEEGLLFGNAWLSHQGPDGREVHDHRKSLVRLRLADWHPGRLTQWQGLEPAPVTHPEVKFKVGPHVYLGFGPLAVAKGKMGTTLKANAAIQAGEANSLVLALPLSHPQPRLRRIAETNVQRLHHSLVLAHHYGSLGGRSRNGWGSVLLDGKTATEQALLQKTYPVATRPWQACLDLDWPHALGADANGPLIWTTGACPDWRTAMRRLAEIKIGLRTQFKFNSNQHPRPEDRHWLSYPVTNHRVNSWGNGRLPNSLRFKIRLDQNQQPEALIFHLPHSPPAAFGPTREDLIRVWENVYRYLDSGKHDVRRIKADAQ